LYLFILFILFILFVCILQKYSHPRQCNNYDEETCNVTTGCYWMPMESNSGICIDDFCTNIGTFFEEHPYASFICSSLEFCEVNYF
jgi:hypothetical protein